MAGFRGGVYHPTTNSSLYVAYGNSYNPSAELGTLSAKKAVALAGMAPHPQDSGLRQGYRKVCGGRRTIPRMLFMGALSASQRRGQLKDFYDRLIANGKKPMVALVALMRKMIVILNAMLRDLDAKPACAKMNAA